MLAPMPEASLNPGLADLATDGLQAYPAFLDQLALDAPRDVGFERSGVLRLAFSDDDADLLRTEVTRYEARGIFARWLDRRASALEAPLAAAGVKGALLSQDEAQVQPGWLLQALREGIAARGGRLETGEVTEISAADVSLAGGRHVHAATVVLAAGSWTGRLPAGAGMIRPVRGQLLDFASAAGPRRILFHGHHYLITKPDGHLLVGATMEEGDFSLEPTEAGERELRKALRRLAPALVKVRAETRVGLRPATPDGLPLVGPHPRRGGIYLFSGHHRNGFLLAPLTARLAADEITGLEPDPRLTALRPARFRDAAAV
jgi:glycine oxidase